MLNPIQSGAISKKKYGFIFLENIENWSIFYVHLQKQTNKNILNE